MPTNPYILIAAAVQYVLHTYRLKWMARMYAFEPYTIYMNIFWIDVARRKHDLVLQFDVHVLIHILCTLLIFQARSVSHIIALNGSRTNTTHTYMCARYSGTHSYTHTRTAPI